MKKTTKREFIKGTSAVIASSLLPQFALGDADSAVPVKHPELQKIGGKFRFAILADPHAETASDNILYKSYPVVDPLLAGRAQEINLKGVHSHDNLKQITKEINGMTPKPNFVVHLGDMVDDMRPPLIANWKDCVAGMEPIPVMVHGNHEDHPDYPLFRQLQRDMNGITEVNYSFDCGDWHFITLPCNLGAHDPTTERDLAAMYEFLEKDLQLNKDRQTIILHHLHFLPVGLSQTEWYLHPLPIRLKLRELFTRYGNVKWAFNGHVHNGIMTSIKTSWEYLGIRFINCCNVIDSRPFGEEFLSFEEGMNRGGYYLIVDVDGDAITVSGRLAGVDASHAYPQHLASFSDEIEPRHFKKLTDFAPSPSLINGDFSEGLNGWKIPYRYRRNNDPLFVHEVTDRVAQPNKNSLYVRVRAADQSLWAQDEYLELYQVFGGEAVKNPVLSASYNLPAMPTAGGGYFRFHAMSQNRFKFLMFFLWGNQENTTLFFPLCVSNGNTAMPGGIRCFQEMAAHKQGFFFRMPTEIRTWHRLEANIASLYNECSGNENAYQDQNIDKLFLCAGTWNGKQPGSQSDAYFSDIQVAAGELSTPSKINGRRLLASPEAYDVSKIEFGRDEVQRQALLKRSA